MGAALPRRHPRATRAPHIIPVSAPTPEGLSATAQILATTAYRWASPHVLARTQAAREHGPVRAVVAAYDTGQVLEGLRALQQYRPSRWVVGPRLVRHRRLLVHLFGDAASLAPGAAGVLLRDADQARAVDQARAALAHHVPGPVWEPGRRPTGPGQLHQAAFVIQWTLYRRLLAQGLVPDAVIGHGQGELLGCVATGRLSLAEAARIVTARSHALAAVAAPRLLDISAGQDQVEAFTAQSGQGSQVCTVYHPGRALVRVDASAVGALGHLRAQPGVQVHQAACVDAAHTAAAAPAGRALAQHLGTVHHAPGHTPLITTSQPAGPTRFDGPYWAEQVAAPRRLDHALARVCWTRASVIALGPQDLAGPLAQSLEPEHAATGLTGAGAPDGHAWGDLFTTGHWLGRPACPALAPRPEQAHGWAERALAQATGRPLDQLSVSSWRSSGATGQDLARLLTDLRQVPEWAHLRAEHIDTGHPLATVLEELAGALPATDPSH